MQAIQYSSVNTPEDFLFWLKGYSETVGDCPTLEQWGKIQHELALVFNKVTPYRPNYGNAKSPLSSNISNLKGENKEPYINLTSISC